MAAKAVNSYWHQNVTSLAILSLERQNTWVIKWEFDSKVTAAGLRVCDVYPLYIYYNYNRRQ